MKSHWLAINLLILLATGLAQAQDDHFEYSNPFGSDGFNQPNLTAVERTYVAEDELWTRYLHARMEIVQVRQKQATPARVRGIFAYGNLLESMAELRAYSRQNPDVVSEGDKGEIAKIDGVLRDLGLRYVADRGINPTTGHHEWSGQFMVDFCDKTGPDKVASQLRPFIFQADGKLRPIIRPETAESRML